MKILVLLFKAIDFRVSVYLPIINPTIFSGISKVFMLCWLALVTKGLTSPTETLIYGYEVYF